MVYMFSEWVMWGGRSRYNMFSEWVMWMVMWGVDHGITGKE